ncbi:MAG: hypothetical protein ACYC1M_16185 [Armatimonadota bacterium]
MADAAWSRWLAVAVCSIAAAYRHVLKHMAIDQPSLLKQAAGLRPVDEVGDMMLFMRKCNSSNASQRRHGVPQHASACLAGQ